MTIKESELYSSLWKSCDELRGGMDGVADLEQDTLDSYAFVHLVLQLQIKCR